MKSRSQVADTSWKADLLRICLTAALCLTTPQTLRAAPDTNQGDGTVEAAAKPGRDSNGGAFNRKDFSYIWRELGTLRETDLVQRADDLWASDPNYTLRAMILRVGREVPATSTAARRSERLAIRATAAEWIRQHIEGDPQVREFWEDEVRDILADSSQVIQWCATARALGRLGEYEFSKELSQRLESKNSRLVQATRFALHELYLVWFDNLAQFDASWPNAQQLCQNSLFMDTAREKDRLARETLIQLLAYEDQRAETLLVDPDPALRAAAAATFGHARNGETENAVELLLRQAEMEIDGNVFQATIEALLQVSGAAPVDSPTMVRLREILKQRIEQGYADLQAPVADALRRLTWSETQEGDESILVGVDLLVSQIIKLAAPHSLTDRDVVVTSMFSLQSLAARAKEAGLALESSLAPLNELVIGTIEDQREPDVVRIAAAKLLPLAGDADSIGRAARVLDARSTSPELRYNLLAALGDMAAELSPADPAALLVLDTLLGRLKGDDANLRRRALLVLGAEKLAPLVAGADPAALIESLGRESVPDLQSQLLDLIAQLGGPQHVESLIALPNFDEIVESGPAGISSLTHTLTILSGDDGEAQVRGVARLLAVAHEATRTLRLREALGVVAALSDQAVAGLDAQQNYSIVRWAMELRGAAGSVPGGVAFLGRLNRNHLPGCRSDTPFEGERELSYVQALFLSDWILLDPQAGDAAQVLTYFQRALELSTEVGDSERRALVLRDRARFQLSRGDRGAALEDYRALFLSELPILPGEAGASGSSGLILELRDLRQGAELLAGSVDDSADTTGAAKEALRLSLVLVQEPNWKLEPAPVRAQDLRDLAERALRVGERESVERAVGLFAGLPELPAEPEPEDEVVETPPVPEGALWGGLTDSRELHAGLVELSSRLNASLSELQESADGAESDDSPEGEQPEAGSEDAPPPSDEDAPVEHESPENDGASGSDSPGAAQRTPEPELPVQDQESPDPGLTPEHRGLMILDQRRGVEQSGSSSGS